MSQRNLNNSRGFTLIEILLSILVFALIGMATYAVLNNTIQSRDMVLSQNTNLTQIQRAFTIIESDILQFAQRKARIGGEEAPEGFFTSGEYLFDSEGVGFSFVRDGWTNPAMILPRSEMQQVAYRVFEQKLQRLYFNHVDNEYGVEPKVQDILTSVSALSLELITPEQADENTAPIAIEIAITTETYGLISRKFPIPTMTEELTEKDEDITQSGGNNNNADQNQDGDGND